MDKITFKAETRDIFGRKTKKGRQAGLIPAVVYGRAFKSRSLWIKALDFLKLLKVSGESTIIELNIDGKETHKVLIHETQKNPITDKYIHVDFFQVRMDEEIETEVELTYFGEAPAVKELGGVLVKSINEIEIRCLPADLPSEIKVDISTLKTYEDRICIKDLKISPKVKMELDPETVVALVSEPRSEKDLEDLEEKVEEDVAKVEGVVKEKGVEENKKEDKKKEKEEQKK